MNEKKKIQKTVSTKVSSFFLFFFIQENERKHFRYILYTFMYLKRNQKESSFNDFKRFYMCLCVSPQLQKKRRQKIGKNPEMKQWSQLDTNEQVEIRKEKKNEIVQRTISELWSNCVVQIKIVTCTCTFLGGTME